MHVNITLCCFYGGKVKKVAGYDGEYGRILIFGEKERNADMEEGQKTLGDF